MNFEKSNTGHESDIDALERTFTHFLSGKNISASTLRKAYYELCGDSTETGNESSPYAELLKEMQRITELHFPLNRFANLVTELEKQEDAIKSFDTFVIDLPVSDKEKILLKSLVTQNKVGDLTCYVNDAPFMKFKINPDHSQNATALKLQNQIQELLHALNSISIQNPKISFQFEG